MYLESLSRFDITESSLVIKEFCEVLRDVCFAAGTPFWKIRVALLSNDCPADAVELRDEAELIDDRDSKENVLPVSVVTELAAECRRSRRTVAFEDSC